MTKRDLQSNRPYLAPLIEWSRGDADMSPAVQASARFAGKMLDKFFGQPKRRGRPRLPDDRLTSNARAVRRYREKQKQ